MILLALALLAATPSTFNVVLADAKPGDVVKLVPGNYPLITINKRSWNPAITIDASGSNVVGVTISTSTGISWVGGDMAGTIAPGGFGAGYGVLAGASANISVTGVHFSDFRTGIVFNVVNGGKIAGNWFTRMSADGIDVALSRGIVVDRNACTEFKATPVSHPDCIQLWSRPNVAPVADITITNNSAVGEMQGISLFNHVRGGVDDGRILIRGNTVLNTHGDGISVYNCRGCTVRDNDVNSLPNYWHRAQLYVTGGSVVQCGNRVPMTGQGTPPCTSS